MTDREILAELRRLREDTRKAREAIEYGRIVSAHGFIVQLGHDLRRLEDNVNEES